ncbi:3309_t:CDS:1, partial [Ambispora gerdemannii]
NNQAQLAQRLIALEQNANNQLTNLNKQFNSLRLTHTKEQKRIELHSNVSDFDKSRQFDRPQLENADQESY